MPWSANSKRAIPILALLVLTAFHGPASTEEGDASPPQAMEAARVPATPQEPGAMRRGCPASDRGRFRELKQRYGRDRTGVRARLGMGRHQGRGCHRCHQQGCQGEQPWMNH